MLSSTEVVLVVGNGALLRNLMEMSWPPERRSPSILSVLAVTLHRNEIAVVVEPFDMSLRDFLNKEKLSLSNFERLLIVRKAAAGLQQIHCSEHPRMLRNVSADNLFVRLSSDFVDVIYGDFMYMLKSGEPSTEMCGFVLHTAPEACSLHPSVKAPADCPRTYTLASDIWSFGILIVEVLLSGTEFRFASTYEQLSKLLYETQQPPAIPSTAAQRYPELAELARRCLMLQPDDRPRIADVVRELHRMRPQPTNPDASSFPFAPAAPSIGPKSVDGGERPLMAELVF